MPTIKDVAELAGVGIGTASRALSGNGSVSAATAERVRLAAEQLKFRPSHAARTLMTGSSQMIGVYIPFVRGTYYTSIMQLINNELRHRKRHMVVAFGQEDADEREEAVRGMRFLLDRDCDGIVVLSNLVQDDDIRALRQAQKHVVIINRYFPRIKDQCFTPDHVRGGIAAAQALLQHRHRQIAIIEGPASSPDNVARISGFMGELAQRGIDTSKLVKVSSDFSAEGGRRAAEALVKSGAIFTAVFCANDETAVGLLSYLQERRISVPHDVSVIGYDDTETAACAAPRLTSVHIPMREVTLSALHWLLNRCYGLELPVPREFEISVTWRASVSAPRRKAALLPS